MKTYPVERARHLVLRATSGDVLPATRAGPLRARGLTCGWLRASGVLSDVELRAFDTARGRCGGAADRRTGPGAVDRREHRHRGATSVGLRAVLARETDRGMEVLAGEIVAARVVAIEVFVTAFDDLALPACATRSPT